MNASRGLESFFHLGRPLEVDLTQDGRQIGVIMAPLAKERDRGREARLWVGEIDGELAPISQVGATEGLPRFSPDGRRLAFASDSGHPGRMALWLDGIEIGSIAGSVEDIRWARDGSSLLVLAADLGATSSSVSSATKIDERAAHDDDPKVVRAAQHWRRLFRIDLDTNQAIEVSPQGLNVFEFDWIGGAVAAVCTEDPSEGAWYDAWIGLIDIESRTVQEVHRTEWQLQCPRISREGQVAWIEGFASDRGLLAGTVHVLGVGPIAHELDATWLAFADEESLWYAGWRGSQSTCGHLTITGAVNELYGGDVLIGDHVQPRVSPSADGRRVAAVLEKPDEPPEVVLFENGSHRRLTSFNSHLTAALKAASWRRYSWTSFDGLEIEGLLALPTGSRGRRVPLLVSVHGGPTWTWSWMTMPRWLLLAQAGYAVFLPNPRGSVGRGQAFTRASLGDMGGADLQDILAGVDALVGDGIVDDNRMAIHGSSYGGFMAAWAITQTDRFAAAIPCSVITNWLSFYLTTNVAPWVRRQMTSDPFDPHGAFAAQSPVYHAHKCTTPTLIIHGEEDLCTPVSQAVEFYNALVETGCETELVIYPREGHGWPLERDHQLDAWHRLSEWLANHFD